MRNVFVRPVGRSLKRNRINISNFVTMNTLTVKIKDKKTEKEVKTFLDALGLTYKVESTNDDTELISSSKAMVKHLDAAKNEERKGKGTKVRLDDIWK
jgi:hypothetical protein